MEVTKRLSAIRLLKSSSFSSIIWIKFQILVSSASVFSYSEIIIFIILATSIIFRPKNPYCIRFVYQKILRFRAIILMVRSWSKVVAKKSRNTHKNTNKSQLIIPKKISMSLLRTFHVIKPTGSLRNQVAWSRPRRTVHPSTRSM